MVEPDVAPSASSRGAEGADNGYALEVRGLVKHFGGLAAIDGVSLSVRPGERRAIIGPNGAGKTTLFRLISGEERPTAGTITLLGKEITRLPPHERAYLGLGRTYQVTNIFLGLSVLENLVLAIQGHRPGRYAMWKIRPASEEVLEQARRLLSQVGLEETADRKASELSYGEQRQLEVALALAGNPKVLLLDEPAAGLSPAERVTMAELIRSLPEAMTVVLIEHDMDVALGLAHRVTCLHFGRVIAEGTPQEIQADRRVQEIYLGLR